MKAKYVAVTNNVEMLGLEDGTRQQKVVLRDSGIGVQSAVVVWTKWREKQENIIYPAHIRHLVLILLTVIPNNSVKL